MASGGPSIPRLLVSALLQQGLQVNVSVSDHRVRDLVAYRWQVIQIVETLVHRQIRFIPIKEGIEFDG